MYILKSKVCILVLATIAIFSCGKKQESIHPTIEKITSSVYASGTIKSSSQYEVYTKVNLMYSSLS